MSDGDALLRAILAHPEEDTPRLVYADWLDEQPTLNGSCPKCKGDGIVRGLREKPHAPDFGWWECQPCRGRGSISDTSDRDRAELIRYQIATGVELTATGGPCAWSIKGTSRELPLSCWRAANAFLSEPLPMRFTISRGFVSHIELPAADFLDHAADVFAAHPVTAVRLSDRIPHVYEGIFNWFTEERTGFKMQGAGYIPGVIYDEMVRGGYYLFDHPAATSNLTTEELAYAELSRACVAYGRSLAELGAALGVTATQADLN